MKAIRTYVQVIILFDFRLEKILALNYDLLGLVRDDERRARRRGGQRGAIAPPAFHLGEQEVPIRVGALLLLLAPLPHYHSSVPDQGVLPSKMFTT